MGRGTRIESVLAQAERFPPSRYMGSKRRILPFLAEAFDALDFETALDAFSGGGSVSYLLKSMGKRVHANDFLAYSYRIADAVVANARVRLSEADVAKLLAHNASGPTFIQDHFNGLYFTPEDNEFLDLVSGNLRLLRGKKRSLAIASLTRAALKKQPRGVFTVVGQRYDDGRRDLRISMQEQFLESVESYNAAVFDNGTVCTASQADIRDLKARDFDLVYVDTPYYSPHSDNDYVRRYHFVEGLATYWTQAAILEDTKTKRLERRDTPFSYRRMLHDAFDAVFAKFPCSILVVSYSSNSIPSKEEMVQLLKRHRSQVEVLDARLTYSFGTHAHKVGDNRNSVDEYLFIAK